jgi:membrane protein required for colicin V production
MLAALVIGIFAALKLAGFTARQLENYINVQSESLYLISVAVTFVLVFLGISILGRIIEKMAETMQLSMLNRFSGVIFAVLKIVIITGILLAFLDRLDHKMPFLPKYTREHSLFFKPFSRVATTIFPSLKVEESDAYAPGQLVNAQEEHFIEAK